MTIGPRSQCDACKHLRLDGNIGDPLACDAFPAGIPDEIYDNERDHRQPIEGDHGVQFEAKAGDEFPEYAFAL